VIARVIIATDFSSYLLSSERYFAMKVVSVQKATWLIFNRMCVFTYLAINWCWVFINFDRGFMSAHFLGQEYGLMSPNDLGMIQCMGGWGQHWLETPVFLLFNSTFSTLYLAILV